MNAATPVAASGSATSHEDVTTAPLAASRMASGTAVSPSPTPSTGVTAHVTGGGETGAPEAPVEQVGTSWSDSKPAAHDPAVVASPTGEAAGLFDLSRDNAPTKPGRDDVTSAA
jgi:hypothetical protein